MTSDKSKTNKKRDRVMSDQSGKTNKTRQGDERQERPQQETRQGDEQQEQQDFVEMRSCTETDNTEKMR